jgi:hypothetical protein
MLNITPLTGHPTVDAIASIRFEGNITPQSWYQHIAYKTPKGEVRVDRLAIDILADIVYWYRPYEKREELTGQVIGFSKKFKEDKLRRSPDALAETLGATPRQVRESLKVLQKLNLIQVECKPVKTQIGVIPNVMHIDVNPEAISNITYRAPLENAETIEKSLLTKWVTRNDETVTPSDETVTPSDETVTPSDETVTPGDETVNSSIYKDFLEDKSKTSQEVSGERASPPPTDAIAAKSNKDQDPPSQLAVLPGHHPDLSDDPSFSVVSTKRRGRDNKRLGSQDYQDMYTRAGYLPQAELRQWASLEIGEFVKLYRKSGQILHVKHDDVDPDFVLFLTLQARQKNGRNGQPPDIGFGYGRIRKMEGDPNQWVELVAEVKGWQCRLGNRALYTASLASEVGQASSRDSTSQKYQGFSQGLKQDTEARRRELENRMVQERRNALVKDLNDATESLNQAIARPEIYGRIVDKKDGLTELQRRQRWFDAASIALAEFDKLKEF